MLDAHGGNTFAYDKIALDFSVNLNPFGLHPQIIAEICKAAPSFAAYPDPECRALRQATALEEQVPPSQLVFGNGAADLIIRLCSALSPRHALVTAPAFSEYEKAVREVGGTVSYFPLQEENGFQITAEYANAVTEQTDIVFLCNPNNPTGRLATVDAVLAVAQACEAVGAILVVDECFLSFTEGVSCKYLLQKFDNLIILKAFTKMYAMAGLRLGYLLCANSVITQKIASYGQSWSVSTPAQVAGVAALAQSQIPTQTRVFVAQERAWLAEQLAQLPLKVFAADANFMLLRSERALWHDALEQGILLRNCGNFHGLDERYFRIGLKQREENQALLCALRAITTRIA